MRVGTVAKISRFAVKSMLGEALTTAEVGVSGIDGDRTFALVDAESGKVASAKDPRKWSSLLGFRARYDGEPATATLIVSPPDGGEIHAGAPDVDDRLSAAVGRRVRLATDSADSTYDYVWDVEGIAPDEVIAGSQTSTTSDGKRVSTMPLAFMAPGTFQDVAPITILTTGALRWMASLYPQGDWNPARFRMNFLVETDGFDSAEQEWQGRRLHVGDVELEVTSLAPRCVMTTLAQQGMDRDRGILQTIARHNMQPFAGLGQWACLGLYANVVQPGTASAGDELTLT